MMRLESLCWISSEPTVAVIHSLLPNHGNLYWDGHADNYASWFRRSEMLCATELSPIRVALKTWEHRFLTVKIPYKVLFNGIDPTLHELDKDWSKLPQLMQEEQSIEAIRDWLNTENYTGNEMCICSANYPICFFGSWKFSPRLKEPNNQKEFSKMLSVTRMNQAIMDQVLYLLLELNTHESSLFNWLPEELLIVILGHTANETGINKLYALMSSVLKEFKDHHYSPYSFEEILEAEPSQAFFEKSQEHCSPSLKK